MTSRNSLFSRIGVLYILVNAIFLILCIWHLASYNYTFSKTSNWTTFNLTYNATFVGSIASSYIYPPFWYIGIVFISLFGSTFVLFLSRKLFFSKGNCCIITLVCFLVLLLCLLLFIIIISNPDTIYPGENMISPWRFSSKGELSIDLSRNSKYSDSGEGKLLQVKCPDGSLYNSDSYRRIFNFETNPNPPSPFTPMPDCNYFYSSIQEKLFGLCCAKIEDIVYSPISKSNGVHLFHGVLSSYLALLVIWFWGITIYTKFYLRQRHNPSETVVPLEDD